MVFPKIVGSISASTTTGNITFNVPPVIEGQYLVAIIRCQSSSSTSDYSNTGWSRIGPPFEPSSATARVLGAYSKVATISDSNTPTTFTLVGGQSSRASGVLLILDGVDVSDPISGKSTTYAGEVLDGNSVSRGVQSYPISSNNSLQLFYTGNEVVSPNQTFTDTTYSGLTEVKTSETTGGPSVTRTALWVGSREVVSATTPQAIYTWPSVAGASAQSISLRGIEEVSTELTATLGNVPVSLFIKTPTEVKPVDSLRKVHSGFKTVDEMLQNPGFTWAHRGGSANFPEMSLHAYTQSMLLGHGAMEISLSRSSDGVWFGHHDETLNRVTGNTGNLNPNNLTWNEIQQFSVKNGQQEKPFMSIGDFIGSYPNPGVVVLDIKYGIRNTTFIDEFFDICHSFPDNTVIVKYFYETTNFAQRAANEGFDTWGYVYPANLVGDQDVMARMSNWTILGLSTSASQQDWDTVLSLGKPVVGHIAQSKADYDSAMSKGAVGVQCANVVDIPPIKLIN